MESRAFERLEENLLKHNTSLLHKLQDAIETQSPKDVRVLAHDVAEMLQKIDKTIAVLKLTVKQKCDLPIDGWGC